jgi:hypothetical protein
MMGLGAGAASSLVSTLEVRREMRERAALGWPDLGACVRANALLLARAPTQALLLPHTQAKVSGVSSLIGGLLSDTATVASVS